MTDLGGGKRIITKDSLEVLIPVAERKRLLDILHSTHLSGDSMFRMSKGKFTWPNLKSDLGKKYKSCEECLVNSRNKIYKNGHISEDLTAPFQENSLLWIMLNYWGKVSSWWWIV